MTQSVAQRAPPVQGDRGEQGAPGPRAGVLEALLPLHSGVQVAAGDLDRDLAPEAHLATPEAPHVGR